MANKGPNKNGCQFYITTMQSPWLNGKHTIFGKVVKGASYVHVIEKVCSNFFSFGAKKRYWLANFSFIFAENFFLIKKPSSFFKLGFDPIYSQTPTDGDRKPLKDIRIASCTEESMSKDYYWISDNPYE